MPVKYNFSHYYFKRYAFVKDRLIYHFNDSVYKPLTIIRDDWVNKIDKDKKEIVLFFNKDYYIPYHEKIDELMSVVS